MRGTHRTTLAASMPSSSTSAQLARNRTRIGNGCSESGPEISRMGTVPATLRHMAGGEASAAHRDGKSSPYQRSPRPRPQCYAGVGNESTCIHARLLRGCRDGAGRSGDGCVDGKGCTITRLAESLYFLFVRSLTQCFTVIGGQQTLRDIVDTGVLTAR